MVAGKTATSEDACNWCAAAVAAENRYAVTEIALARELSFCRLEHIVPWVIREKRRERGMIAAVDDAVAKTLLEEAGDCAECGSVPQDGAVVLVHERSGERILDAFCSLEHLRAWASAGGHWAR
ncbi:MAG: hypothetical protein WAP35_01165 [Solirubrobacterales bacterium]